MIIKETTIKKLEFNNSNECKDYMEIMKKKGYEVLSQGSENYWYFTCKKEE